MSAPSSPSPPGARSRRPSSRSPRRSGPGACIQETGSHRSASWPLRWRSAGPSPAGGHQGAVRRRRGGRAPGPVGGIFVASRAGPARARASRKEIRVRRSPGARGARLLSLASPARGHPCVARRLRDAPHDRAPAGGRAAIFLRRLHSAGSQVPHGHRQGHRNSTIVGLMRNLLRQLEIARDMAMHAPLEPELDDRDPRAHAPRSSAETRIASTRRWTSTSPSSSRSGSETGQGPRSHPLPIFSSRWRNAADAMASRLTRAGCSAPARPAALGSWPHDPRAPRASHRRWPS